MVLVPLSFVSPQDSQIIFQLNNLLQCPSITENLLSDSQFC